MVSSITRVRGRLNFEQLAKVKQIFNHFDRDRSGVLEYVEFKKLLLSFDISLPPYELKELFNLIDGNTEEANESDDDEDTFHRNGIIELKELVDWFPTILALKRTNQFKPPTSTVKKNEGGGGENNGDDGSGVFNASTTNLGMNNATNRLSTVNWAEIRSKLPFSKTDPTETAKRRDLFNRFDVNGNGFLSLAEVDKGLRDVIVLPAIFNVKPVIMRAFQSAKGAANSGNGKKTNYRTVRTVAGAGGMGILKKDLGPDFVEFSEFRLLLKFLYGYFQLWEVFERIDADGDRRIDEVEFSTVGIQSMLSFGMLHESEARSTTYGDGSTASRRLFNSIDGNGGGYILFDEFAQWAIGRNLFGDE